MNKKTLDQFNEYIQHKTELINKYNQRRDIVEKILENYKSLMRLSDEGLISRSNQDNNCVRYDPVYRNLENTKEAFHDSFKFCNKSKIIRYIVKSMESLENRTMKEDEYNYLLNASPKQILKDKEKELYSKKSLFKGVFN